MQLYHGSDHIVEHPQFGLGKPYNDFGLGFYCTQQLDMAKEWSASPGREVGYANKYHFDCKGLDLLDLTGPDYTALHWLSVLLENRSFALNHALAKQAKSYLTSVFAVDYQQCDAMVGNRADDSYFSFAKAFLNGAISYNQLKRAMSLGKLGKQVVIKNPQAFDRLQFQEAVPVQTQLWLPRRQSRDAKARADFVTLQTGKFTKDDLFIQDILRQEVSPSDERL